MDKETLSNYGWIVICVLVLAVMIALATPFGTFVSDAVKGTTQGLFDTNQKALNSTGLITMDDQSFGLKSYAMLNAPETVTKADQAVFRSEADIDKFVEVRVDSNVVDEANYTVTEGSTIITFTPEYTKTLENGNHTIEIVSNDGMAECEFSVDIPKIVGSATFDDGVTLNWDELKAGKDADKYYYNASAISDTSIGAGAFSGSSLTSITIPDSVTSIGNGAFDTTSFPSITIPDSVTSIGESAFSNSSLENITIPDSVTSIGENAFYNSSLKSITIPDSVTSIEKHTFYSCYYLENIIIPDSVTTIGDCAFYVCTELKSITIPDSVTSIGDYAFADCYELESITFKGKQTQWNAIEFGSQWIGSCPEITVTCTDGTIIIPEN